jgi:TolB-like protein
MILTGIFQRWNNRRDRQLINSHKRSEGCRRTSSFHFKGRDIDLRSVGQKLNVRTLLEGSIRKHNLRLRITAQLINAEDGIQYGLNGYDRDSA